MIVIYSYVCFTVLDYRKRYTLAQMLLKLLLKLFIRILKTTANSHLLVVTGVLITSVTSHYCRLAAHGSTSATTHAGTPSMPGVNLTLPKAKVESGKIFENFKCIIADKMHFST